MINTTNKREVDGIMLKMTIEFQMCVHCPYNSLDWDLVRRCAKNNKKIDNDEMFVQDKWPSVCPMREVSDENSNP